MCEHPDELAADLMECYGVCLDAAMGGAYSAPFVAALAAQLPQDCRWRIAYDRDIWWTGDRLLQANLINTLNGLVWGMSDPKSRGPRPKLVGPSWADAKRERGLPAQTMSRDALMAELSRPRRKREEVAADE